MIRWETTRAKFAAAWAVLGAVVAAGLWCVGLIPGAEWLGGSPLVWLGVAASPFWPLFSMGLDSPDRKVAILPALELGGVLVLVNGLLYAAVAFVIHSVRTKVARSGSGQTP